MHMLLVNKLITKVETNTELNQVEVGNKCSVCTNKRWTTNCRRIFNECIVCQSLCKLLQAYARNKMIKTCARLAVCTVCVRKKMHS